MRRLLFAIALCLVGAVSASAQLNPLQSNGAPAGTCSGSMTDVDTTTGNLYTCNLGVWKQQGAGLAPATPGIPTYNGPNIFYAANYASAGNGPLGKGWRMFDGSWTNSTKTVTIQNNSHDVDPCVTSAQMGWLVSGSNGPATGPTTTATSLFGYPATITGVNSCTSFTISNTPTTACTSSTGNSLCQIVMAPYDDYPAIQAAFTAMANALQGTGGVTSCANAELVLPNGLMWLSQPPQMTANCNYDLEANGASTGYWVKGECPTCTTLFPAPSGLWTASTNKGAMFFNNGTAVGNGAHFSDFTVDCAGTYLSGGSNGFMFVISQNSSMRYVNLYGCGRLQGVLCAGGDAAEAILDHVNIGGNQLNLSEGQYCKSSNSAYFWGTGTQGTAVMQGANGCWSDHDSFDFNISTGGPNLSIAGSGVECFVDHAIIISNATNEPLLSVTGGAILHLQHSKVYNCINGSNGVGINVDSTPSFVYLLDTKTVCTATGGKGYNIAGTLYDLGGNSVSTTIANTLTGTITADGHSIKGVCTGVGTASSTLALRVSGTSTTGTGIPTACTSTTLDAGMPITGARTLLNLKVIASAAGTNASSGVVTVLKNGSATALTCTIGTATSCADGLHTVTTADGDLISFQFTTQTADTLAGVQALVNWQ